MSDLAKAYEPQPVESKWYQSWLDQKFFVADPNRVSATRPAYSIVIPPPNVTGVLTLGHVLNNTIQDILARKARMDGKEVLWLPGTDHAGIATQTVVERTLKKSGAIRHRNDLGREKFLEKVWEWKEKHGGIIIEQLKKLGASCDWTRERFTMDPEYSRCVQKVFVELYKKGFIYRGKRMVNWCPVSQTALSDEEVLMKEQKGLLYHFKVEIADAPGTFLTIATTRPETIPGDTAVAVNPKDPRYAHLIGKHVIRPLPIHIPDEEKLIPIIGDDHVDFEFGTGVLKVTPAHDKADFDIGVRHGLAQIDVMNPNGTMNALAGGSLVDLDRFEARKAAAEHLRELQCLEKEEPYTNNVGFSERADVPIEPRLSEQWFLKYPSTDISRTVVSEGRMRFFPDRWAKVYDHWMENLQDWCISRQLWWGHRIPVWSKHLNRDQCNADLIGDHDPATLDSEGVTTTVADANAEIFWKIQGTTAAGSCDLLALTDSPQGAAYLETHGFAQDPDVLDTWCSSWLWPFATMGWPQPTDTLKTFYPTTDLVTGPDIIFFWVARMIMAGYEFMGEMPFKNVYFTGIIRDKQGRKMSKSLGNSPDPLDLIDQYGADALRFGVMRAAPLGQDILFDEQNVTLGRNFCNKLWNACRFRQMQGGDVQGEIDPNKLRNDDKWILIKLHIAIDELNGAFTEYKFNEATTTLYRFFWSEYCDWYVETTKAVFLHGDDAIKANVLAVMDFILSHAVRLFHPFLPFITEELWHGMGYSKDMPADQGGRSIMFAPWPKSFDADFRDHYSLDDCYLHYVNAKFDLVSKGRNLRSEARIASNKKVRFILKPSEEFVEGDLPVLKLLLNAETIDLEPNFETTKGVASVKAELGELYLPLEGLVDVEAEIARLTKELDKINDEIAKVEKKLANPNFVDKVPPNVLAEHRKRLEDWIGKKEHALKAIDGLQQ